MTALNGFQLAGLTLFTVGLMAAAFFTVCIHQDKKRLRHWRATIKANTPAWMDGDDPETDYRVVILGKGTLHPENVIVTYLDSQGENQFEEVSPDRLFPID